MTVTLDDLNPEIAADLRAAWGKVCVSYEYAHVPLVTIPFACQGASCPIPDTGEKQPALGPWIHGATFDRATGGCTLR